MSGDAPGHGLATRVVHAGLPEGGDGDPLLPGPVFASLFRFSGEVGDRGDLAYHRFANPSWQGYEAAVGELEGGHAVLFPSGMAAVTAAVMSLLAAGDVLVAPSDAYPGIRALAEGPLARMNVEVRLVPSTTEAFLEAMDGAALVWAESPTNPGLGELDVPALARAAHAGGALLTVDSTMATPLRRRPLELGADVAMTSASKYVTGHSDLVLGYLVAADPDVAGRLREWRTLGGAIPGPFEAWLAHRSLATLDVRLERQEATARALVELLGAREDVTDVRYPGLGCVVCFTLDDADAAQRFLTGCEILVEATSFGGVHTTAERRGRWGTDAIPDGFVRLSVGIEDPADLLAAVTAALDAG